MGPYLFFIVATGIWIAFCWTLAIKPVLLDRAWGGVRRIPLIAKPIVWIAFLPWLSGLAIWEKRLAQPAGPADRRRGRGARVHRVLVVGDAGRRDVVMSTATVRRAHRVQPARLFGYVSFAIMVGGWVAFLIALIASRQTLDDVWTAVRDLPLALEALAWVLGFPFVVGLAIWNASWDEAVRLAAIAVLAVVYTYAFRPREPKR